jgi:hypothetical protein
MKPFKRTELIPLTKQKREEQIKWLTQNGKTRKESKELINEIFKDHIYINDQYQVNVREVDLTDTTPPLTHLSIKRLDKEPIHDWRDLQQIKNLICGNEREAIELYPAESRVVDTVNQFHLWVFPEGMKIPCGFPIGIKNYDNSFSGTKQREKV